MNETIPFFKSLAFWVPLSLIVGFIVGFFTHVICAISGQASRLEERCEEESEIVKDHRKCLEVKREIKLAIDKEGKPDRE